MFTADTADFIVRQPELTRLPGFEVPVKMLVVRYVRRQKNANASQVLLAQGCRYVGAGRTMCHIFRACGFIHLWGFDSAQQ